MTSFFKEIRSRLATHGSRDLDRELAAIQPFTALDYALNVDRHFHPATWRVVKGTVFEQPYRRAFPHHDFDKSSD